jgi:hypothetical protein
MKLPPLSFELPKLSLPFEVPAGLYATFEHFAVTLPVVILFMEIINTVFRRSSISLLSFFFIVLMTMVIFVIYVVSDNAQMHLFNSYIMLGAILVVLMKLFEVMLHHRVYIRLLYVALLVFFTWLVLEKESISHSMNSKSEIIKKSK